MPEHGSGIACGSVDGKLRQPVGDGDADLRAGLVELSLGGTDIGTLLNELRWQTQRQVRRQPERGERDVIAMWFAGESADQGEQHVMLLLELLLQRRQARLRGRHFGLLGQHIGLCRGTDIELVLHDDKLIALDLDDIEGRRDLAAQRRFLHRRGQHIRGQCEIGRLQFEALIVGLRRRRLDLAALAAKHVRRVGDVDGGLVQIEKVRAARLTECRR